MRKNLFNQILIEVCTGKVKEPFKVKDFPIILNASPSFLNKHALKPNKKFDSVKNGNPYFIWKTKGRFVINPKYKNCNEIKNV